MNQHDAQPSVDAVMQGRRFLVSLPPSKKERTRVTATFLEAAKQRFDLEVDAICAKLDRKGFEPLVAPNGRYFIVPHLLQSQEWESDPKAVAATEQRIHEAELAAGLPMGRVVLGAAHGVGRAFNAPVRRIPCHALVGRILKDNSEPFRITRRLFRFADDALAASNPDLVCAYEYATVLNGALWLAATLRGIPCVSIRFSKINSGEGFWSLDRKMLNTIAVERGAAKRQSGEPVSDAAKARIKTFREHPATVAYIANTWRHRAQQGFLRWHLQYARAIGREVLNSFNGQDRALAGPLGSRLSRYYWHLLMTYWHRRFLHSFDDNALAAMKYVYFPMHKEAEFAHAVQAT